MLLFSLLLNYSVSIKTGENIMKQVRVLSVFALIFNLAIIAAVIYASAVVLGSQFLNCIHFFTVLSNLFIALIALICVPFNFIGILKGKLLPKVLFIFKLIATTLIGVTFFVATFFLSYFDNWDIAKQYGNFQFTNVNFFYHFLVPLMSVLAFIFFDRSKKVRFPVTLFALIPLSLYIGFYAINYFGQLFMDPLTGKYDWYGFTEINGLSGATSLAGALVAFAFGLAALLFLFNRLMSKPIYRQLEEQSQPSYVQENSALAFNNEEPELREQSLADEEEPQKFEDNEAEEEPAEEKVEESEAEEKPESAPKKSAAPKKASAKKPAEKKPEPVKAPKKPAEKKPEASKKPAAPKSTEKKPAAAPKKDDTTKVYHLTKRKEDGMWAITFVGGKKPVKLFKTKKEAEEYLATLTKNQGATALIRNSKGAKAGKFASSIKSDEDK